MAESTLDRRRRVLIAVLPAVNIMLMDDSDAVTVLDLINVDSESAVVSLAEDGK